MNSDLVWLFQHYRDPTVVIPDNERYDPEKARHHPGVSYIPSGIELIDKIFAATDARSRYQSVKDYGMFEKPAPGYNWDRNEFRLFGPEAYEDTVTYAETIAHELVHWSGKNLHRYDDVLKGPRMGPWGPTPEQTKRMGQEEITAQIGCYLLMQKAGHLTEENKSYTLSYLKSWGADTGLSEDLMQHAGIQAIEAYDYLLTLVNAGETK